jgi:uncharacterized protein YecE (DUF72 family)
VDGSIPASMFFVFPAGAGMNRRRFRPTTRQECVPRRRGDEPKDHLLTCAEKLHRYRIAIEFRNKSRFANSRRWEVLAFERDHGLAHVVVDEPQGFPSSIPAVWEVTSPQDAVVRLHGRNRATWNRKGLSAAERFNYLYSEDELKEFVGPVQHLAAQVKRVHVLFNNCHGDQAQRNARELRLLMEQMGLR